MQFSEINAQGLSNYWVAASPHGIYNGSPARVRYMVIIAQ